MSNRACRATGNMEKYYLGRNPRLSTNMPYHIVFLFLIEVTVLFWCQTSHIDVDTICKFCEDSGQFILLS